jgi:putative ABC transport system permease protein
MMATPGIDNTALILSYCLVLTAVGISWYHHLKIEKDIVLSSLRATVQLVVVGFILQWLFAINEPWLLFLILFFMCCVSAIISGNRGRKIPGSKWIAFMAIGLGSLFTFMVLYWMGVIQPEARYVIPLGGMIIGNSMKAASLTLNRLVAEMGHQRARIENLLALGATARQASLGAVQQATKAAMIPTVDTMKTVGLVHLPGIMTGFIIAGGSPLMAVKYQLAVIYMLVGAAAITCLTISLLAYSRCFNRDLQLLEQFRPA